MNPYDESIHAYDEFIPTYIEFIRTHSTSTLHAFFHIYIHMMKTQIGCDAQAINKKSTRSTH